VAYMFKKLLALSLLAPTLALAQDCPRVVPQKMNWRVLGFLWKPIAEHNSSPLVALNNGPARRDPVIFTKGRSNRLVRLAQLPLRSVGDVGWVYQNRSLNAAILRREFRQIFVRVIDVRNGCRTWRIRNPTQRSDGIVSQTVEDSN